MKRKFSQINPEDPSPIGASFPRGFRGVPTSKSLSAATSSRENRDFGCVKRVRFADLDNDKFPESISVPLDKSRALKSLDPKTSEYAFFKKLKEVAGHGFDPHSLHQDEIRFKKFKSSECFQERSSTVENGCKDFRSSSLIAIDTPANSGCFISPLDNASKNSGLNMERAGTVLGDTHNFEKNMEDYGNNTRYGGDYYRPAEFFSRKRQNLRQWVAHTSLPEIDELCSKGYDFVSLLLNRLFPESDNDKSLKVFNTGQVDNDSKFKSFTSPRSDCSEEFRWMPARNSMEVEFGPSWDVGLSSHCLEIPSEGGVSISGSLTSHSHETYFDSKRNEYGGKLGKRVAPIICNLDDSTFDPCTEEDRWLSLSCLKELDEIHYPVESLYGRKNSKLLQGWDFDQMTDESKLSVTHQNAELTTSYRNLSISHGEGQLYQDNRFNVSGLCAPQLLPFHAPNLCSLWHSPSASNASYSFGGHFLEIKDDMLSVLNSSSLPLLCTTDYQSLPEHSNGDAICKGSNSFLSPQSQLWFMSKVLNVEHHCPATEALLISGLDFDLGQKCFPEKGSSKDYCLSNFHALEFLQNENVLSHLLTKTEYENSPNDLNHEEVISHLGDGVANIREWSPFYHQLSIDRDKAWTLVYD